MEKQIEVLGFQISKKSIQIKTNKYIKIYDKRDFIEFLTNNYSNEIEIVRPEEDEIFIVKHKENEYRNIPIIRKAKITQEIVESFLHFREVILKELKENLAHGN